MADSLLGSGNSSDEDESKKILARSSTTSVVDVFRSPRISTVTTGIDKNEAKPLSPSSRSNRRRSSVQPMMQLELTKQAVSKVLAEMNDISLKKLKSVHHGEELRSMLRRILLELQSRTEILESADQAPILTSMMQLRSAIEKLTRGTLQRSSRMNKSSFLLNQFFRQETMTRFQEISTAYTSLCIEVTISLSSTSAQPDEDSASSAVQRSANQEQYGVEDRCEPAYPGDALVLEGHKRYFGYGVKKNYHEALQCYEKAVKSFQNPVAMLHLAEMYQRGIGTPQDIEKGYYWLLKAEESGLITEASYKIALYLFERGEAQANDTTKQRVSYAMAMKKVKEAADLGLPEAQTLYGVFLERGLVAFPDCPTAAQWYQKAAESGHVEAQTLLGKLYFQGKGVEVDYFKAFVLFQKGANERNAVAQNNLAMCYESGKGVEKDTNQAMHYYRLAAEQNHLSAMCNLGFLLLQLAASDRCPVDRQKLYTEAMRMFLAVSSPSTVRSVTQASVTTPSISTETIEIERVINDACYGLGLILEGKMGFLHDPEAAVRYYARAADSKLGHRLSSARLAEVLYTGTENYVKRDLQRSFHYYSLAAAMHHPDSLNAVGLMREEGIGCQQDLFLALEAFEEACTLDSETGHLNLANLLRRMPEVEEKKMLERREKIETHYRMAAERGHPLAKIALQDYLSERNGRQKAMAVPTPT